MVYINVMYIKCGASLRFFMQIYCKSWWVHPSFLLQAHEFRSTRTSFPGHGEVPNFDRKTFQKEKPSTDIENKLLKNSKRNSSSSNS